MAEVAENRRILDTQKIAELTEAQKSELADALPVLEAISEGALKDTFAEDIPFLLEPKYVVPDRNPVLAGYAEVQRTFGLVAQIGILIRVTPGIIRKIDGSAGYKAARIALTISGLIALGIALIGVVN